MRITNIKLFKMKLLLLFAISWLMMSCTASSTRGTLASLNDIKFEVKEEKIDDSLEKAMASYEKFLNETPETEMTPEALRRLADLKIQKEYEAEDDAYVQQEVQQEAQQLEMQNKLNISAGVKKDSLKPVADSASQATDIQVPRRKKASQQKIALLQISVKVKKHLANAPVKKLIWADQSRRK